MMVVEFWKKMVPMLLLFMAGLFAGCPDEGASNSCLTGYYTDPQAIDPNACIICQVGTPGYDAYEKAKNNQVVGGNNDDAFGFDTVVAALTSSDSEYVQTTGALDNPGVSTACNPTCGPGFYCCALGSGPMCVSGTCLNSSGGCRGNNTTGGGNTGGGNLLPDTSSTGGDDIVVPEDDDSAEPSID